MTQPDASRCDPWYVCMTKPRQEHVARRNLQDQGYEVFLPELRTWKQRAGAWQATDEVMFPRYAFVRPGRAGQAISPVRSTPGVSSLVRFGTVLGVMADDRLQALRHLVQLRASASPAQPFADGDAVVFARGPLQGVRALVSSVAAERVMVLMTLLGREQVVAVGVDDLQLA